MINFGAKHVGIAQAIRKHKRRELIKRESMMLIEVEWSSEGDEEEEEDLGLGMRNNAKHEALNIVQPD